MWVKKLSNYRIQFSFNTVLMGIKWDVDENEDFNLWIYFFPCISLHLRWSSFWVGDVDDIPF